MAYPILKPNYSWWTPNVSTVKRSTIVTFNFADSYTPSDTVTDSWDASLAQDGSIMVYVEGTKLTIAGNGSGKIAANPDSSRFMFTTDGSDSFSKCTAVNNLPLLDTSNVTTMNRMFRSCTASTIDLSGLNTSKVTDMYQMFGVCTKIPTQSFAHFDTSNVEDMSYMFYQCTALKTIDFENWDVSKVKCFDHFLSHSQIKTADITNWDVSSCENFNAMFNDTRLTEIDLSKWNFKSARIFSQMFDGNTVVTKIIFPENIDTSNVICFEQMFYNCNSLKELDLSKFDTRKACCGKPTSSNGSTSGNTGTMFYGCRKLEKITLGKNFTFLGDGTTTNSAYIGSLPTPSATYIDGADGNWYDIDGNAYVPADVPNLKYATYYASAAAAKEALDSKTYISYGNLSTYHETMKSYIDNAIVQPDWNQSDESAKDFIKNRTHYDNRISELLNITFNGDYENYEHILAIDSGSIQLYLIKMSDNIISHEDLNNCTITIAQYNEGNFEYTDYNASEQFVLNGNNSMGNGSNFSFIIRDNESEIVPNVVLSKGIWFFAHIDNNELTVYASSLTSDSVMMETGGEIKQLDEKFLPDNIARLDYVDAGLETKADAEHNHSASNITSGTLSSDRLPVISMEKGGTGQTSIEDTTYTTARYRASSLYSIETTPTVNGVIAWTYE